jgi:hypothetical protein
VARAEAAPHRLTRFGGNVTTAGSTNARTGKWATHATIPRVGGTGPIRAPE